MTFADELREAGSSKAAILHEFLLHHDPKDERIHAFVEGYDDPAFYRNRIGELAGARPTFFYACMGKQRLYEVFGTISARVGTYRHTLYFADKDLSDLLGEEYPKDERIYVTEYYSVENYLASAEAVEYACAHFIRLKNCRIPLEKIVEKYQSTLKVFHRVIVPVMAWVICVRRHGKRPNFNNVQLAKVLTIDDDLRVQRLPRVFPYLCKATQTPEDPRLWRELRATMRDLLRRDPKSYVRGKFETWFLVEFLKKAFEQLEKAATAHGGAVDITVRLERNNAVDLLAPHICRPASLEAFLRKHLAGE